MNHRNKASIRDANAPWNLWKIFLPGVDEEAWQDAARKAAHVLGNLPASSFGTIDEMLEAVLMERQFGEDHWRLSLAKRVYYGIVRPILPVSVRPLLRRLLLAPQKERLPLDWPIEDRYVRFQFEMLRNVMEGAGARSTPYVGLWPDGKRYAFVLTHDIETARGQGFVRQVMELEERYGFRSCFNFVPEDYEVDLSLLDELRERGFEVGVHGLKHDGKLFRSQRSFQRRVGKINRYLKEWNATGFRAPFTHRHPEWMQMLNIEYDSSFFDTDPFETIPGGTMSIWPFMIGDFVELPYTLPQDHTLISTLGEKTPKLWLEKVDFIEQHGGLAMMITHPDYLLAPACFAIYEEFLKKMSARTGYWHQLPGEVARWWKQRLAIDTTVPPDGNPGLADGAVIGTMRMNDEIARGDVPTSRPVHLLPQIAVAALQVLSLFSLVPYLI
ncbi:MAG: hypothetical protein ABIR47_11675 [Candidatus Kapaibacterium sp.]